MSRPRGTTPRRGAGDAAADPVAHADREEARRVARTLASAPRVRRIWRAIRLAGGVAAAAILLLGLLAVVAWLAEAVRG